MSTEPVEVVTAFLSAMERLDCESASPFVSDPFTEKTWGSALSEQAEHEADESRVVRDHDADTVPRAFLHET